jgi:hypothetical protein
MNEQQMPPLPEPDMTMPSIAPDGPGGAHFYRVSTVRQLLAANVPPRVHELLAALTVNDNPASRARFAIELRSLLAAPAAPAPAPLTIPEVCDLVDEAGLDWQKGWPVSPSECNRFLQLAMLVQEACLNKWGIAASKGEQA